MEKKLVSGGAGAEELVPGKPIVHARFRVRRGLQQQCLPLFHVVGLPFHRRMDVGPLLMEDALTFRIVQRGMGVRDLQPPHPQRKLR